MPESSANAYVRELDERAWLSVRGRRANPTALFHSFSGPQRCATIRFGVLGVVTGKAASTCRRRRGNELARRDGPLCALGSWSLGVALFRGGSIEHATVHLTRRNAAWLVRQHRLDGGPFIIAEFVAHDLQLAKFKNAFFPRDCPIPVRTLKLYQQRRRGGRPRNSLRELQGCQAKAVAASASQRGAHGKIRGKAPQL